MFLAYLAMGVFAYAIIYAIFNKHWAAAIAAVIEIIITADAINRDDVVLLAITFFALLIATFVLYFSKISGKKG